MRKLALVMCVGCGLAVSARAQSQSQEKGMSKGAGSEKSCGQVLSEQAKIPEQVAATVRAMAEVDEAHAKWIGTQTPGAKAEHEKLMKIAQENQAMAKQANTMASTLRSAKDLPNVKHGQPPEAVISSMEKARDEQEKLGQLLTQNAQEMTQQINSMKGVGGSGMEEKPNSSEPASAPVPEEPKEHEISPK